MTQYSIILTGPDEEKILRLAKKYGHVKPGSFLRRALQMFPESDEQPTRVNNSSPPPDTKQPSSKTSLESLDEFLKEHLATDPSTGKKERIAITHENKSLIFKLYTVGNYYRERGTEDDRRCGSIWMDILTDGGTPSDKGVEIINRDFERRVLRDKSKEKWFVKNPDMSDADQYLLDYPIKWES